MRRRHIKLLALLALVFFLAYAALRSLSARYVHVQQEARADRRTFLLGKDARDEGFLSPTGADVQHSLGEQSDHTSGNYLPVNDLRNPLSTPVHWSSPFDTARFSQEPASILQEDPFEKIRFLHDQTQFPQGHSRFSEDQKIFSDQKIFPQDQSRFPQDQTKFSQDRTTLALDHTRFPQDYRSHDVLMAATVDSLVTNPGQFASDDRSIQQLDSVDHAGPRQIGMARELGDHVHDRHRTSNDERLVHPKHQRPQNSVKYVNLGSLKMKTVSEWEMRHSKDVLEGSKLLTDISRQLPQDFKPSLPASMSLTNRLEGNPYEPHPNNEMVNLNQVVPRQTNPPPQFRRHLVYLCEGEEERCGGWADRQRGMLSVFLLAHVTGRIFKVDMRFPCNLTNFLQPVGQDWWKKDEGQDGLVGGGIAVVNDMRRSVLPGLLQRGVDFNVQFPHGTVYVQTTRDLAPLLARSDRYGPLLPEWARDNSQATRFRLGWPLLATPTAFITRRLSTLFLPLTQSHQADVGVPASSQHEFVQDTPRKRTELASGNGDSGNRMMDKSRSMLTDNKLSTMKTVRGTGDQEALRGENTNLVRGRLAGSNHNGPTGENSITRNILKNDSPNILKRDYQNTLTFKTLTDRNLNWQTSNPFNTLTPDTNNAHTNHRLLCAHLRMGRNPNMPEDTNVRNDADAVQQTFTFLQTLLQGHNSYVFIATDDQGVRMAARRQFQRRLIDHGGTIVHIDRQGNQLHACAGFETAIFDQLVLSRCDVLVMSRSGFSRHAAYLRQQQHGLFLLDNGVIEPYSIP